MHENIYTCDGCDKKVTTASRVAWPDGWMHFNLYVGTDGSGEHHACSRACAGKAASKAGMQMFERKVGR